VTPVAQGVPQASPRRPGGPLTPRGDRDWPTRGIGSRSFNPLVERLRGLGLSEAALGPLRSLHAEVRNIPAGGPIIREGEVAARLHIMLEGWSCRYTSVDSGRQSTAFLLPGDICNLDALQDMRLPYGVNAMTACKVAVLRIDEVRRAATGQAELAWALFRLACDDNRALVHRAACLGRRPARARLAHLICELQARSAAAGIDVGGSFMLPATQEELADLLGLTAVHVNRVLQSLRADRLVTLQLRWLTILDWDALATIADYAPDP
jgi:CRP-like cAMP-binding protein